MQVFYTPDILNTPELPEEEARHCLRVLRLGVGDEITLTDGKGYYYKAEITSAGKKCVVALKEKTKREKAWQGHVHIAMAPVKNMERNEWFAEKAVEIGIDELTFPDCRYSERKTIKLERIRKIMVSAIKQSLTAYLPQVNGMLPFEELVKNSRAEQKFIAHCYEEEKRTLKELLNPGGSTLILIGPEGDFSKEEIQYAIQNGFVPVSLGKSRLRTETAALVACVVINQINQ